MSQERGRSHNRIRSLSPPQRAKSRSHSRERSRSREASPFSIDSKLASNHIISNPFKNQSIRDTNDYLPILEDDESDIELRPILPVFSYSSQDDHQTSQKSYIDSSRRKEKLTVDPESLNQVVLNRIPTIKKQIYDDFEKEFYKDAKAKTDFLKKTKQSKDKYVNSNNNDNNDDNNINEYDNNGKNNTLLDDSGTDYSTDSDSEVIQKQESASHHFFKTNSSSIINDKGINNDKMSFITNPFKDTSNFYHANSFYDIPRSSMDDSNLLNNAFENIENTQNESQPSSVLRWLNRIPKRFSLNAHISNNFNANSNVNGNDEYNLHEMKSKDDLENNAGKVSSSSSSKNILRIANDLLRGKLIENQFYEANEFDEILNDIPISDVDRTNDNGNSGITSNLMKLHNQFSYSSEDIFEDEYDSDIQEGSSSMLTLPTKMAKKVRGLRNSSIFSSRESLLERPYINGNDSNYGNDNNNNNSIKLPNFVINKEDKTIKKIKKKSRREKVARITVHIVNLIQRQEFLLTLCKAFMLFGAPNHRLEEYMTLTARVLEVDATFVYLPGMMLINFADPVSRTSDLKLVRTSQGLDLNKLDLAHDIFESVVYDRVGVDEAAKELDELLTSKPYFNTYWIILFYGISSMFVLIFFSGSWLDLGPAFVTGSLLGFLQCVVAPKNAVYSSVFEIGSAVLISFIARAIGSINDGKYFCFSAIVLSGLCMILPGYMILRGALEIQSKSIVSGVVGMFYAIIYSLFLGFGLTLGSALYGWIDSNATTETTCSNIGRIGAMWNLLFVPLYNIFMCLACQARFHQLSVMITIACCGYVVTYFSSLHIGIKQFNSALGSFTVGLLSNIYDRWGRSYKRIGYCSTTFTSMICGVFDLVPGSVAARNVLSSGLLQLEQSSNSTSSTSVTASTTDSTLTFGVSMIEIAIGITVGLFISTLFVYPFGKKNNNVGSSIGL